MPKKQQIASKALKTKFFVIEAEHVSPRVVKKLEAEVVSMLKEARATFIGMGPNYNFCNGVRIAFQSSKEMGEKVRDKVWEYNNGAYANVAKYDDEDECFDALGEG